MLCQCDPGPGVHPDRVRKATEEGLTVTRRKRETERDGGCVPEKAPHRSIRETRTFYTNMTTPPQESIRDCYKNRRFSVQAPQIKVRNTRARSDDERSTLGRLQFFPAAAAAAAATAARGVSFGLFRNVALQPHRPREGR